MPFCRLVNLDDAALKAMAITAVRAERGEMIIEVREPTRSDRANRFYWDQVVEPLSEWLTSTQGQHWSKDDTHEYLKRSFLPVAEKINPVTGEVIPIAKSTTRLNKSEFSELCEKGLSLLDWLRNNSEGKGNA